MAVLWQPCPQGLSFFKGKALGTRLVLWVNGSLSLYQLGKPLYRNSGEVVKKKSLQILDLQRLASLTGGGGGVLTMMAKTGWLRPKGVPFFRLQVHERVEISVVEVYGREGNLSFGLVKGPKRAHR